MQRSNARDASGQRLPRFLSADSDAAPAPTATIPPRAARTRPTTAASRRARERRLSAARGQRARDSLSARLPPEQGELFPQERAVHPEGEQMRDEPPEESTQPPGA